MRGTPEEPHITDDYYAWEDTDVPTADDSLPYTPGGFQEPYVARTPFVPARGIEIDFSHDAASAVSFVEAVHPNFVVDGRMCLDTYEVFREIYLATTANPMTHTEFALATQRFLTVFNDGHLSRSFLMLDGGEITLFQDGGFIDHLFLARGDELFLADDNMVITDTQVLSIGGVSVSDIFAVVDYYYGAYNEIGVQRARGRYARYQLMLQLAGAGLYERDGQLAVDLVVVNGGVESIMEVGFVTDHPASYRLPSFIQEYRVRSKMVTDDVLYISFRGALLRDAYIAEAMAAIRAAMADGVRQYVIDLRNTPGGDPAVIDYIFQAMNATPPRHGKIMRIDEQHREMLEYHFPPQELRYFLHMSQDDVLGRGLEYIYVPRDLAYSSNPYNVFIAALTSERTFSGGTSFAAEIADSGFGIVIGEPSATAPTGYGWGRALWLEKSGLQIRPHYTFYLRPDVYADQLVLWPDIFVNEWEALDAALEFFAGW